MPLISNTQPAVDLYLHMRVLISMILGLSVTRLVGGLAGFVQHPGRYRISLIHLGWVAWTLLNVVTFWWWEFGLSRVQLNFAMYFFVCFYASMYFFLSVLLFPEDLGGCEGYQDYFLSRRVWFFGFVALAELLDVVDTLIKGTDYLQYLGPEYPIGIVLIVVFCGIAAVTRDVRFHLIFVGVVFVHEVAFFIRTYNNVG